MKNFHHLAIYHFVLVFLLFHNSVLVAQCPTECVSSNTFVGTDAGAANDNAVGVGNTFIGQSAGPSNTEGERNTFVGQNAGTFNTTGSSNSFFGEDAGYSNEVSNNNSFFGRAAGFDNAIGRDNSFFGANAGMENSFGSENSFFGKDAGFGTTSGSSNSIFGFQSGLKNRDGYFNCFFGKSSGYSNDDGVRNVFIGNNSGFDNDSGSRNVCIGSESGYNNIAGDNNTNLGFFSGGLIEEGSSNICIGFQAGPFGSVSNRLYIDVETDDDPLIYGEFDNDLVRINGSFEVTAGLTNPSSSALKEDFTFVNAHSVLDKINRLHIEEWSYKEHPKIRHVGAVAEDFYDAFGLGSGSDNISTIDADGIALLAIQALSDKVEHLEDENSWLLELINDMKQDITLLKTKVSD